MAKTIDEVIAESEIRDIHLRFCRANDRRDEELMRSCFHPEAIIELHKPLDVDEFIDLGKTILSNFTVTWHTTSNQLVEVDGSTAWAEHYTASWHRIAPDDSGPERDMVAYGRYIDRVEKREGHWRIAHRKMLVDFTRTDEVHAGAPGPGTPRGARDRSDYSYTARIRE